MGAIQPASAGREPLNRSILSQRDIERVPTPSLSVIDCLPYAITQVSRIRNALNAEDALNLFRGSLDAN